MVFWLNTQILEYRIRPESLHMILSILVQTLPCNHGAVPSFQSVRVELDNVFHNLTCQNIQVLSIISAYLVHLLPQALHRQ